MKNKMAAIFATLMIALMAVGFAYAHWEKIITINGTVTTGTFHLTPSFTLDIVSPTDKYPATVDVSIVDNTVTVTITNAFPSLTLDGMFDLENDGSIPAGLKAITFNGTPVEILPDMEPVIEALFPAWMGFDVTGWGGVPFGQIDPGETAIMYFTIHFTEDTPQDYTYTFTLTFEYWNWNEV